MISKPLVFVSSTSRLEQERRELAAKLPRIYEAYFYEWDRARRSSPEEHCREMIEKSDVFLGVLGPDYGSAFPGSSEKRSIVEWEFDTARQRSELEMLTFVRQLAAGENREPAQQVFVDRVKGFREGHWCQEYATPAELVERARASLEQWLAECWVQIREAQRPLKKIAMPLICGFAGAAVLVLVVFLISPLASAITRNARIGICASVAGAVALCAVLAWRMIGGRNE